MKTQLRSLSEHEIQQLCINYLKYKGWYVQRINSGRMSYEYKGHKGFMMLADRGTPDILFGLPYQGKILLAWCEVKTEKGKLTFFQAQFKKEMEEKGICHIIARNLTDLEKGINEYMQKMQGLSPS